VKKVFITGSKGFVGRHLVNQLQIEGFIVKECDMYDCDVTSFPDIIRDLEGDVVIHLAARVRAGHSMKVPYQYIQTNVLGLINVLEVMRLKRIPRLIFISSAGVKGYTKGAPYLWSKRVGELFVEMYAKLYGIEAVIIRPTNIYGEGNNKGIIYNFTKAKKENRILKIYGDGSQTRDFVHVDDVVSAIIKAVGVKMYPKRNPICVEIGTGVETSMIELAKKISPNYTFVPIEKEEVGLKRSVADISKAQHHLKWTSKISLEEGIRRILK